MRTGKLELPPRPYVPPTAFGALGLCGSAALVLNEGWRWRAMSCILPVGQIGALVVLGFLVLALGVMCRKRMGAAERLCNQVRWKEAYKVLCCVGVGMLVGCVTASVWLLRWQGHARSLGGVSIGSCTLVVKGDPSIGEFGISSTADVLDGVSGRYRASVRFTADEAFEAGSKLRVVGRLKPLGDDEWARSRFMKGEVAHLQVVRVINADGGSFLHGVDGLRSLLLTAIDPRQTDARALLAGTICGRTTELNKTEANEAFARCGLSHLVAVSGSHLAFISMLLEAALRKTRWGSGLTRFVVLGVMVWYVLFTGCAPSAIRSVVMVAASMATTLFKRRAHPLSGLSWAICVLMVCNPGTVYDLGFQLSALSVLFLLVFGKYVAHLLEQLGIPSVMSEPLSLTLVAQWATLPLTVPVFGEMSVVAPLANVVVGPVMSALLVVGLLVTPAALLPFGACMLVIPDTLARVSIFLANMFSRIPYASVKIEASWWLPIVAYGFAVLAYIAWKDVSRATMAIAFSLVGALLLGNTVRWLLFAPPSVVVLDVGQADAILLRDGPHTMLVDAGVDEQAAIALTRNYVMHLDAVVVTHWDRDHWGGLPDILDSIPVDRIIVAEGALAAMPEELEERTIEKAELAEGDCVHVGAFACTMVWPDVPVDGEENCDSVCLGVSYERAGKTLDMLLTGDAECEELAVFADEVGDIDVLKVGHHGSKVSLTGELLDVLEPEIAVASAGEDNSYGHPDRACVQLAKDAGALFLCTKDVGDIVIYPGETGPRVTTERSEILK